MLTLKSTLTHNQDRSERGPGQGQQSHGQQSRGQQSQGQRSQGQQSQGQRSQGQRSQGQRSADGSASNVVPLAPGPSRRASRSVPAWAPLAVCCLAQFMVVLDISIVNVALPRMKTGLDLSTGGLQWVVNAYTLTFAGLLMLGGRAADLFGRRRVFLLGIGLFTVFSLLGGLAQNGAWLITARALQGAAGAVLAPATLSLLTTTFPGPSERRRALGAWSATAASGAAVGVLAGGLLTELLDWRWVLFVNVPVGHCPARRSGMGAVGVPGRRRLSSSRPPRRGDADGGDDNARLRDREHEHPPVGLGPNSVCPGRRRSCCSGCSS